MSAPLTLRIDGRTVQAEAGTFVLQAARAAGIDVPSLCDHPDLEPFGGCRLCMVEVTHPDWGSWSGLMTRASTPWPRGWRSPPAATACWIPVGGRWHCC